mmetsp:Transcript_4821/g.15592  ORF Transcript_4821/g.15592 Transcript_4821/m.15592 type:complete len:350 (+) Transcript_4821:1340-2389(+)
MPRASRSVHTRTQMSPRRKASRTASRSSGVRPPCIASTRLSPGATAATFSAISASVRGVDPPNDRCTDMVVGGMGRAASTGASSAGVDSSGPTPASRSSWTSSVALVRDCTKTRTGGVYPRPNSCRSASSLPPSSLTCSRRCSTNSCDADVTPTAMRSGLCSRVCNRIARSNTTGEAVAEKSEILGAGFASAARAARAREMTATALVSNTSDDGSSIRSASSSTSSSTDASGSTALVTGCVLSPVDCSRSCCSAPFFCFFDCFCFCFFDSFFDCFVVVVDVEATLGGRGALVHRASNSGVEIRISADDRKAASSDGGFAATSASRKASRAASASATSSLLTWLATSSWR